MNKQKILEENGTLYHRIQVMQSDIHGVEFIVEEKKQPLENFTKAMAIENLENEEIVLKQRLTDITNARIEEIKENITELKNG